MTSESPAATSPALHLEAAAAYPTDRPRPTRPFTRRGHQSVEGRAAQPHAPAERAALACLLVATALLYLWGLGRRRAGRRRDDFTAHTVDGLTLYDLTTGS